MPFISTAQRVPVGPGTLYVAPLGTTEPTSVTGQWAAGWVAVGFTDKGNDRSWKPTYQAVSVDEELWPLRQVPDMYEGSVAFSMAEITVQNTVLAYNGGITTTQAAGVMGTNPDGSQWVEPPLPGAEIRVMIGWDAAFEGSAPGNTTPLLGRTIYRQCIQTGEVKGSHQKGNNKYLYTVTFSFEKPSTGLNPFRDIFPASVAT
ncbi:MAG: hypothetical protein JWO62_2638 [Acidimicrobiaceae bacterium]|nr:hypothetical protein [Acidimicrobiaceae bacterium]